MRLLKRSLPLLVAVPLVLGTSTAWATSPCPAPNPYNQSANQPGQKGCNGPNDNGGSGVPGPGPGFGELFRLIGAGNK
jgi:hypothetical protein